MLEELQRQQDLVKSRIMEGFFGRGETEAGSDVPDFLMEKSYVGDLFFSNGKTYIYTEYSPGKFDWHIVDKKTPIPKGKGVNGRHGAQLLQSVYTRINKAYTDEGRMTLRRTPKGNWRLLYDDQDVGETLEGDVLTEAELKEANICYQSNRIVDNFDLMGSYMEFNSPDDVYFVQIIKRWKDNKDKPDAEAWRKAGRAKGSYNSGGEFLNYWLIHSQAELDALKNTIVKICSYNNARAYMSINSRRESQVNQYLGKFKSRFSNPNDPRVKNAEAILYGQAKTGPSWRNERLRVLLDIDATSDATVRIGGKVTNVWDETEKRIRSAGIKVAARYETPSGGLHLVLNNKNNRNLKPFYSGLKDFDGGRDLGKLSTVHPSEDVKMVLYSDVTTAGYE